MLKTGLIRKNRNLIVFMIGVALVVFALKSIYENSYSRVLCCDRLECELTKFNFKKGNFTVTKFDRTNLLEPKVSAREKKVKRRMVHDFEFILKVKDSSGNAVMHTMMKFDTFKQITKVTEMQQSVDELKEYVNYQRDTVVVVDSNMFESLIGGLAICLFGFLVMFASWFVPSEKQRSD